MGWRTRVLAPVACASGLLGCATAPPPDPTAPDLPPEPAAALSPADRCAARMAAMTFESGAGVTRDAIPLLREDPAFPLEAAAQRAEGVCEVTFDVRADGAIDAGSIAAACASPAFVEAATRAVARWCYAPKVVDGAPVASPGHVVELTFDWME